MIKKLLIFSAIILILGYSLYSSFLAKNPASEKEVIFSVQKGEGLFKVAQNLEKQGLIKNKYPFYVYVTFRGKSKDLKAGDYSLSEKMTISEIAGKILSGDIQKNRITLLEGWKLKDVYLYLRESGIQEADKFLDLSKNPPLVLVSEFSFLKDKPKDLDLEGYIFPDTYEFFFSEKGEDIVKKILNNFDEKFDAGQREEIARRKKTVFEIITMASLIEKEVRTLEDKKIVSGILWKRMEIEMPLQVDATISYITGKKTTRISIAETKIDSPYNTYKYKGLPKGPISNPGLESILAAIYPKKSAYLYYLTAPGGKTIFSKTLEEHNLAKYTYLK